MLVDHGTEVQARMRERMQEAERQAAGGARRDGPGRPAPGPTRVRVAAAAGGGVRAGQDRAVAAGCQEGVR